MVAAVFNDDVDLSTFFDDLKDIEDPLIDDNLNDLLPSIWSEAVEEEEPSSKFDNRSVSDFALQEALVTEGGTVVNKMRLSADNQLRSFSPVSVLSSGSGLAADFAKTVRSGVPVQVRARTKRGRPSSSHRLVPASWTWTASLDENETRKPFMERKRKTKKSKVSLLSKMDQNEYKKPIDMPLEVGIDRKCTHCDITVTPQWRLGPMGPKTLCNACGVRYKSGRLFPEYRPAASPTFSPSKHSNSHRKVLEMRKKDGKNAPVIDMVKNVKGEENHLVPVSVELISDGFNWS